MTQHATIGNIGAALLAGLALGLGSAQGRGAEVTISVTNNHASGGFALTPFWLALHDGTFDMFDAGSPANAGVELLAELGDASGLNAAFAGQGVSTLLPSGGPVPPFRPGDSNATTLSVAAPSQHRFLSYASMIVPSNDLFVANGNPAAFELFDPLGNFLGEQTILIFGERVYDAGTEVNTVLDGGAFVAGVDATLGTVEGGVVHLFFSRPTAEAELDSILGTVTPPGEVVTTAFERGTLLATIRITAVPEPSTWAMGLSGLLACLFVARRKVDRGSLSR